jgi:hypothetical protein
MCAGTFCSVVLALTWMFDCPANTQMWAVLLSSEKAGDEAKPARAARNDRRASMKKEPQIRKTMLERRSAISFKIGDEKGKLRLKSRKCEFFTAARAAAATATLPGDR